MSRRPLTNLGMWALEDAYAALLTIERDLGPLMADPQPTRTALVSTLAHVRITAANARASITEVHPTVRTKVSKAGRS
jgi:hypothetical protein